MDRYEEALERAKMILCNLPEGSSSMRDIETIFPELKESEDEKIRKFLVELVSNDKANNYNGLYKDRGVRFDDVLAYLEKQKDTIQAKVEQRMEYLWDKLPDAHRVEAGNCTPEEWKALGAYMELEMNFDKGSEGEQQEQKPAEWSEKDERMLQHIVSDLREFRDCETDEELISDYEDEISWLKSLKDRGNFPKSNTNSPSWKPSKEQMEALKETAEWKRYSNPQLFSLYEELKKQI